MSAPCPAPAPRRGRYRWIGGLLLVPLSIAVACLYLTEPWPANKPSRTVMLPSTTPTTAGTPGTTSATSPGETSAEPKKETSTASSAEAATWPTGKVEGDEAKRQLLKILESVQARLERKPCYTAKFLKQERIKNRLGPVQTIDMKVRHRPFAVYLKYLAPREGREVIFAEGMNDDHMIAHESGLARRLVPRLKVAPNSPLALADTRHPITDAGLFKLMDKLIHFRKVDLEDPDALTILDWWTDEQGRRWARSTHVHGTGKPDPNRPFFRVTVLYDPETYLPHAFYGYDWPEAGQENDPPLGESYVYEDVKLDAQLSENDFDPTNEEYSFSRF